MAKVDAGDRVYESLDRVYESLDRVYEAAQEALDENGALYYRVQNFEDAVASLRLLHDETHEWAFSVCDNPVCKLFREWA